MDNVLTLPCDPEGALIIREPVGLTHQLQVLQVALPASAAELPELFSFRDTRTGRRFAAQRSRQHPAAAFVLLALEAHEALRLVSDGSFVPPADSVTVGAAPEEGLLVSNGRWSIEMPSGEREVLEAEAFTVSGPIRRMRVGEGPWRGSSFLDTRRAVRKISTQIEESGPLRTVVRYRVEIGSTGYYETVLTCDAAADFVRLDEIFETESGDQIVWDFEGKDLPSHLLRLDSSASYSKDPLPYFYDSRLARLACWTQYSQLFDFSDGFALAFAEGTDAVGFVTLAGGDWRGNAHNFLEAWTRRWWRGDPGSRRLVPAGTKADATPAPESVAARSAHCSEAHFNVEGWLHRGRRSVGLVLTSQEALRPLDEKPAQPLGHFEEVADRPRYREQQSLLRRIQTQHGVFPLAAQLALPWEWPPEDGRDLPGTAVPWQADSSESPNARAARILDFLAARIFGFWEGSGAAYSNAVVSRRLAPAMEEWEWLAANRHLSEEQLAQGRAWFAFLVQLFHLDHYYPGPAAMTTRDASLTLEPAFAGMANQNFFTDIFNVGGMAAQVFFQHPHAEHWRRRFADMWQRQLEYHVYPESGVWEESHTYFHHVLLTVLPTLERRRQDGVGDGFADPVFQRLVASLLKTLSPRDACFEGWRHTVALGDHGVELLYRPLYRQLAHRIAPFDARLAGHLAWAYRELGGNESLTVEPEVVPWEHEYVQGLGYFFRSRDASAESLLVLRCGQAWAHHHNDEGSLQFFAAGRAWIVDSAFSYPQKNGPRKIRADGHSRWTPRDLQPLNYFWQFNRGWITRHDASSAFPYAVAYTPIVMAETPGLLYFPLRRPIGHWRSVVQLSPVAFLIVDRTDLALPQVVRFHVPADAEVVLEQNPPATDQAHYLRICSLSGAPLSETPGQDGPTTAGERFSTREIRADFDRDTPVAFLVLVEPGGSPSALTVEFHPGRVALHHPDFAIQLEILAADRITVRNLQTSQQLDLVCSE